MSDFVVIQCASLSTTSSMKSGAGAGEGTKALRVSLRASRGGEWEGCDPDPSGNPAPEELSLSALRINQPVRPMPLQLAYESYNV